MHVAKKTNKPWIKWKGKKADFRSCGTFFKLINLELTRCSYNTQPALPSLSDISRSKLIKAQSTQFIIMIISSSSLAFQISCYNVIYQCVNFGSLEIFLIVQRLPDLVVVTWTGMMVRITISDDLYLSKLIFYSTISSFDNRAIGLDSLKHYQVKYK